MSAPSIYFSAPNWSMFKFPPDNYPPALPPPHDESTFKSPFAIPDHIYNGALDPRVPITIGTLYVISVNLVNAYNRRNGNKPWPMTKTRAFQIFVILHNVGLAVYSGVTFAAMTRAADRVWPGFDNTNGLAGVADALCKMHGPRGLGDAVTFNGSTNTWGVSNSMINLLPEKTPDPTDVGRLWNEGLAFWGWVFYLSKFYEVLDTFVIVAKGKRSATLQTYHHAGAMLCMWAGIRYMSPPIWMFVWINSLIHTLMYTYFTLSALGLRVPLFVKRTLTTMQITQFLFGATFAAAHLFVKYDIPIATAYKIVHPISSLVSAATSAVAEVASSATSVAESPVQTYGALLKRVLLRAAGEEGVAENVRHPATGHALLKGAEEAVQRQHEETRWRSEYTAVSCIDTSGQTFAIWLNLIYLAPLTALFVRFFVRAYTSRGKAVGPKQSRTHKGERSAIEAAKGVDREVDRVGKKVEDTLDSIPAKTDSIAEQVEKDLQAFRDRRSDSKDLATETVHEITKEAKAIKGEVEDELRGDNEGLSADDQPAAAEPNAPSSPSKKSKRRKNKDNASTGADAAAADMESTASLDTGVAAAAGSGSGADTGPDSTNSAETAKVKPEESFADAVKQEKAEDGEA